MNDGIVNVLDYGAVGNGFTDDSAAIQAAIAAAVAQGARLYIPPATGAGYLINTPLNATDLEGPLFIYGAGMNGPAWVAAYWPPSQGSVLLGNTGLGHPVIDCCGSNHVTIRDLSISSIGLSAPSTIGILLGTSTTSPPLQAPGGANYTLENIGVWLKNADASVPIYYAGGAGLSRVVNVWTLGVHGLYLTAHNELGITSPYVTIGGPIGVDGMVIEGGSFLGYGGAPVFTCEMAHCLTVNQLYMNTILGGPAYCGQPYAMRINDCTGIQMTVECDYFPSLLIAEGVLAHVEIRGVTYPNVTPIPQYVPLIAYFAGEEVRQCVFAVTPVDVYAPENYHYTTNGASATMRRFVSSRFVFDTSQSPNVMYANATDDVDVPYFNLTFDGDADDGQFWWLVNQGIALPSASRYTVNGISYGDARP